MKVDALIPCYNSEAVIGRAVQSVLSQRRPPDSLIVHDDASNDRTLELVTELAARAPSIRVVRSDPNVGILASRLRLVRESTADVVCFLDHDDAWPADYLERVERAFERESVVATIGSARCVAANGRVVLERPSPARLRAAEHDAAIRAIFLTYPVPSWSCLGLRRAVAAKLSMLPRFHSGEEFALLALALADGDAEFLDVSVTRHVLDGSASRQARRQHETELALFCWFATRYPSLRADLPAKLSAIYANSVYRYTLAGDDPGARELLGALARGALHPKIPAAVGARLMGQRLLRWIRPGR